MLTCARFFGDVTGRFFALDAGDGSELWSFRTGSGHPGSAITCVVRGRHYIAYSERLGFGAGRAHRAALVGGSESPIRHRRPRLSQEPASPFELPARH